MPNDRRRYILLVWLVFLFTVGFHPTPPHPACCWRSWTTNPHVTTWQCNDPGREGGSRMHSCAPHRTRHVDFYPARRAMIGGGRGDRDRGSNPGRPMRRVRVNPPPRRVDWRGRIYKRETRFSLLESTCCNNFAPPLKGRSPC